MLHACLPECGSCGIFTKCFTAHSYPRDFSPNFSSHYIVLNGRFSILGGCSLFVQPALWACIVHGLDHFRLLCFLRNALVPVVLPECY